MFSSIVGLAQTIGKAIGKAPLFEIMSTVVVNLPNVISGITEFIEDSKDGMTPEEAKKWIDNALLAFDNATGEEGFTIIKGIDPIEEEKALDHLKEFLRTVFYAKYGVKNGG